MTENFAIKGITDNVLTPALAEVEIAVAGATGEVRGRLIGPSCRFSSTVEVAYPLRPTGPSPAATFQIIIPEPCLWEPQSPFLYHGPVELWRDGKLLEKVQISHGLRSLALGPSGLRLNGKPIFLRGVCREHATEAELVTLRESGFNALMAPAEPGLWEAADRLGFLMIGRPSSEIEKVARQCHAATLGWLLKPGDEPSPALKNVGLELDQPLDGPPPRWASFTVATESALIANRLGLPALVLSRKEIEPKPGVIGWVAT